MPKRAHEKEKKSRETGQTDVKKDRDGNRE